MILSSSVLRMDRQKRFHFTTGQFTGHQSKRKRTMKHLNAHAAIACTLLTSLICLPAEAGLFRNGTRAQRNPVYVSPHQSHVPYTKMGQKILARKDAQDTKTAQRTGQTFDEVREKRIRRLEVLGAVMGGAGAGLSGAASTMNYSAPATTTPSSSSSLPSSFSNQMQWNSFNRSYSTNPWHAPVR
jgi:hypothetical protein